MNARSAMDCSPRRCLCLILILLRRTGGEDHGLTHLRIRFELARRGEQRANVDSLLCGFDAHEMRHAHCRFDLCFDVTTCLSISIRMVHTRLHRAHYTTHRAELQAEQNLVALLSRASFARTLLVSDRNTREGGVKLTVNRAFARTDGENVPLICTSRLDRTDRISSGWALAAPDLV